MALALYGYWRSSAAYRVRLALALKGLSYESRPIDLRRGDQRSEAFLTRNPQGLVPALDLGEGRVLRQSGAIIEWLEEAYPSPALLPADPLDRAEVRAMAGLIACDIHPLNNLRVLNALRAMGRDDGEVEAWAQGWIGAGFDALESRVRDLGAGFCFGERPTLADCFLVPQIYSARRFRLDLAPYPRLSAAAAALEALPGVAAAHPDRQPDAD